MSKIERKRFTQPDETRAFVDKGRLEVLTFGGGVVGRAVLEPGFRWSQHVKPIAGTERCEASHLTLIVSGRLHVVMENGEELDLQAGDVAFIPPGHDSWVVGNEPCVALDFKAAEDFARPRAQPESQAPQPPMP